MQNQLSAQASLCQRPSFTWSLLFVLLSLCSAGAVASVSVWDGQQRPVDTVSGGHPIPRVTAVMGVRG